jgi:type II secretory pathway pseudopilin PulG
LGKINESNAGSPTMYRRILKKNLLAQRGYTLDQTILIIAIIAILITVIILTVGWKLLGTAAGTRLAGQLGDVKDALSGYYGQFQHWPQGTTSNPTLDAAALAGFNDSNGNKKNYLVGLLSSASGVTHNLNLMSNRNVLLSQVNGSGSNWPGPTGSVYEVVEFQNISGSDFTAADAVIDAADGGDNGKIRVIAAAGSAPAAGSGCFASSPTFISSTIANSYYDVCYAANNSQ